MDHKEHHHQEHEKKREEHKKEERAYEAKHANDVRTIHPAWFVAIGVVLIIGVLFVWIILYT